MLTVIFSNSEILALNKPPQIHSVARSALQEITASEDSKSSLSIAELLRDEYPETATASPSANDSGLINRLDYATSGILLVARNRDAWNLYHQLFNQGMVNKRYLVLCDGEFSQQQSIEGYIGTDARRGKRVYFHYSKPSRSNRYQISESTVKPLTSFPVTYSGEASETSIRTTPNRTSQNRIPQPNDTNANSIPLSHTMTLAQVTTSTGRRHQVRVHMATLGYPLCGDPLYNRLPTSSFLEQLLHSHGIENDPPPFFLHAGSLEIQLPNQVALELHAPAPEIFTTTLTLLQDLTTTRT